MNTAAVLQNYRMPKAHILKNTPTYLTDAFMQGYEIHDNQLFDGTT